MKNFLKGLFGVAFLGAAAVSAYYLLTRDKYGDYEDDFDEFDEEDNDDLQDFLDKEKSGDDHYVTLDLTKDKAGDDDKIIGDVRDEKDNVVKADSEENEDIEGFSFTDLT